MKSIRVITDSHSSITQKEAQKLGIRVLPMPFLVDGESKLEESTLSRQEFFEKLKKGSDISTSQPSPAEVMRLWEEELQNYDEIIHIPISSGLSGSCSTAETLAKEEPFAGRVYVVDNGRVATPLYRSVLDALELLEQGHSAREIKELLEKNRSQMNIYVAVDTLEHLKKGGRISAVSSALGTALNIKPVLQFDVGTLTEFKKCHGMKAARKAMITAMQEDLEKKQQEGYGREQIHLLAATSADEKTTASWLEEIHEAFPDMDVLCEPLSLGVCCHIGEGGLGIGYSCQPE